MMTLDQAIKHAEEVAEEQDELCKRYDDASGYSRSHNESIRVADAKWCERCAKEHRQLAEWLRDYKRLKEQKSCEDAISRQAVLAIAGDSCLDLNDYEDAKEFCDEINELPPVEHGCLHCQGKWIPVSERLPKPYTYVNATCRSLVDNREDWVVETLYLPIPKENNEQGYSDWGNIPMLNWHKAEVVAWMERKIPEPYKESEEA